MNKSFVIKQLNEILIEFDSMKSKSEYDDLSDHPIEVIWGVISKAKAAVARIGGLRSEYYKDVESILNRKGLYEGSMLRHIAGTVMALKNDLENDYLKSLSDIIQSEVFSDYLEMAEHLIKEGYKDPSAVLIGSTLEIHLRELCNDNGIAIEFPNSKGELISKKADTMNADLAKASVYTLAYQKQVTAWLGLRNSAAHGKYSDYKSEEINLMLQGVRQFILATKK